MSLNGVLVLAGPPCSGKSVVAEALISDTSRVSVQIDGLFDLLLPSSDRNSADRMLAYDGAHLLARMLLAHGLSPVLECTYSRLAQRTSLMEALAEVPSVPVWAVEFAVSPDEAVRRFRNSPGHQGTDLTEQLVFERAQTFPYFAGALHLRSEAAPREDLAKQIVDWLESDPVPIDRETWVLAGKSALAP